MSKKKKKPNAHQIQKLAAALYKNEFFTKFRELFNLFCNRDLYQQIPHSKLDEIYSIRSHSVRTVAAKGNQIPVALLKNLRKDLKVYLKREKFKLGENDNLISLYDLLTVGLTLIRFSILLRDDEFPEADKIKQGLKKFRIDGAFDILVRTKITKVLNFAVIWYNDISKSLYWLDYQVIGINNSTTGIQHLVSVHNHIPQSCSVKINGINRPAVFLESVLPQSGPEPIFIKPSDLNINSPFAGIPMKIYVQNHALIRLTERIDSLNKGYAQYFMFLSFDIPKIFYDTHNNLLVEYRIYGKKAGYFRVDIVEGIVIVRTFLFITNNDTPEGQLLEKNTGLQKTDKKYLAMDKLSTFMSSDIGDSKEFRKIIDEAGCHSLIELHETLKDAITKKGNAISEQLLVNYLNKDQYV